MRFRYVAVTLANERHIGWVEAPSPEAAAAELRLKGLVTIRLEKASAFASIWTSLNREVSFRPPLTASDLANLSQEWAGLVEAGISVEESLGFLQSSCKPSGRNVLARVREEVKEGSTLHEALAHRPDCFPLTYVTLVQAGETAGSLGSTLRRLADDLASQRSILEDIRNALLYPAFLLITAVIGISTLLVVVVPNLENLFGTRSHETLPTATRLVIATSHLLREGGIAILISLSVLAFGLAMAARTDSGRLAIHRGLLKTPVVGFLVLIIETGRFTRSLGALLKGGVTVSRAMPIAIRTVANQALRTRHERAHALILTGSGVGDALAEADAMSADAIGLIRMGERTGQLDASLERIAVLYEGRATRRLKALTTVLTPVLTIGFGLLAGVIIYAMLSTILSINDLASQ
ncbi:type II secretion system F family protein [Microvirga terricola]|uniref:Type II secretion system F family protein n=1 Tax=Microvirga terricola TaxID=2719797 RepID=A0ABX0VII3_9HYPH|nr:type II secretion system F family protein [Microvirga terricola]NIX78432.1 type II secretion system F family protein [Microvirga terricola]